VLSATVHKDIGEYTEKVVGRLSARTLACVSAGIAASFGAAAGCYLCLGIRVSDATLPVMAASMPFWLLGFWRPMGLKAEEFVPLWLDHFLGDGVLLYESAPDAKALAGAMKPQKTDRKARRAARRKGAERRAPTTEYEEPAR
jgi:hypothetical protein